MASDVKVGVIIDEHQQRDAIHVAIAPVVAAHILVAGEHVGFTRDDEQEPFRVGRVPEKIGIVDPFLTGPVMPGQRFWLFLYIQTITSLRHDWTHPAFAAMVAEPKQDDTPKAKSERWLRHYAEEVGVSYRVCMEAAADSIGSKDGWGEYHTLNYDTPDIVYREREAFWRHYEVVTGVTVEDKERTFFNCAC